MRNLLASIAIFAMSVGNVQAASHHRHHVRHHIHSASRHSGHPNGSYKCAGCAVRHHRYASGSRPGAWCGWYMRKLIGVADAAYNLARNWAHYGHATTAHVGAIVVWNHHVGKIVGGSPGHWEVLSGNDGHRVRTRERSTAGAIAFRE